jgi:hypothetical protein
MTTWTDGILRWGEETTPLRRLVQASRKAAVPYAGPYWRAEYQDLEWFRRRVEERRRAKIAAIHAAATAPR